MDKITIERETLLPCPFCGCGAAITGTEWGGREQYFVACTGPDCHCAVGENYDRDACPEYSFSSKAEAIAAWNRRAALAQKAEPPSMPQGKSLALLDLDSVEHMQGGANGPTIRLRGFINAQTGPTAPQPPIDNAFVADGCEQFSPPAEPAPVPCCGKYETCSHACTPRGKWLGRREAERAALAAQPAEAQREPVAWRHSKTGRLYDSVEEVPLADGDEWAEPLYATPATQQAPEAWRQWSTKLHDWDYSTNRGDLRSDTPADPLFVAAAQPVPLTDEQRNDCIEAWSSKGWGDRLGEVVRICIAIERAHGIAAAGDKP